MTCFLNDVCTIIHIFKKDLGKKEYKISDHKNESAHTYKYDLLETNISPPGFGF